MKKMKNTKKKKSFSLPAFLPLSLCLSLVPFFSLRRCCRFFFCVQFYNGVLGGEGGDRKFIKKKLEGSFFRREEECLFSLRFLFSFFALCVVVLLSRDAHEEEVKKRE